MGAAYLLIAAVVFRRNVVLVGAAISMSSSACAAAMSGKQHDRLCSTSFVVVVHLILTSALFNENEVLIVVEQALYGVDKFLSDRSFWFHGKLLFRNGTQPQGTLGGAAQGAPRDRSV